MAQPQTGFQIDVLSQSLSDWLQSLFVAICRNLIGREHNLASINLETFLSKAIVVPYIRLYLFERRMKLFRSQNKDVMDSNHRTILYQSPKYSVTLQIQPIRLQFSTFRRFQKCDPSFRSRERSKPTHLGLTNQKHALNLKTFL